MLVLMILSLVKARLGISSDVRDTYLTAIVKGVLDELQIEKGIGIDPNNNAHILFCADYAVWNYQSVKHDAPTASNNAGVMPRHLQYRLHNMLISAGG